MAGDSENNSERFNFLLFGVDSNARRFKTNLESILEKYQRPFEDDDLLDLENLTIKKNNGLLQRKRKVSFGSAKLKCSRGKGTSLKAQALDSTFTISKDISMAIKRDCDSFLVGAEVDDDEDAETLSPLSSEDEEDDTDDYDSSDNSDSSSGRNECLTDSVERSSKISQTVEDKADEICSNNSQDETYKKLQNVWSGFDSKSEPRQSERFPGRRRDFRDTCGDYLNATFDINTGFKAVKTLSEDRNRCCQGTCKSAYYQKEHKETEENRETKVGNSTGRFSLHQLALSPCLQRNSTSSENPSNGSPLRNSFNTASSCTSNHSTFKSVSYQKELKETSKHGETKIDNSLGPLSLKQLTLSPSLQRSMASNRTASNGSPLRNSLGTATSHASHSNITSSRKHLKLVSIASPLKCESLNSSGNSSKMSTSLSSSFSSPASKSIASSFGDLTLRSLTSPKRAPRDNRTIDKILCSPGSQQSSPKSVKSSMGNETFVSNALTLNEKDVSIFKSPKSAVKRRIIPTKVDITEKRQIVPLNLFPKNGLKFNGRVYKNNIAAVQVLDSVDETLRTTCTKSDCKTSCSDGNFAKVCESLPPALQKPKSMDIKLCTNYSNSVKSNFSRPRIGYPNANSTELSIVCETELSTGSLYTDQSFKDSEVTSNCSACKVTAPAELPRTNYAHLKEISSIGRSIDPNNFCVNVSFSSSESDLKDGINNFDFIFQELHAKQKPAPCHSNALACDKNPTLDKRNPLSLGQNSSPQLVKKLTRSRAHADVSVLSRSTQTSHDSESESNWKSLCYPPLIDSKVPNHLGHHGFNVSKWKTQETKKMTGDQRRGFKRKDFSTSDYFTDSSSPRKFDGDRSELCSCASRTRSTQTNKLKLSSQLTKSVCHSPCQYSSASAPSFVKSSPRLGSAQQSLGLLTQNKQYFDAHSLLRSPIIVDRNKLRKRLALEKKNTHCLEQTLVNNSLESTGIVSYANSIVQSSDEQTQTEASNVSLENNSEKYGSKKVNGFKCFTKEKKSDIYFKDMSVQTNDHLDCKTFIVSEKKENCHAPFLSLPKKSSNTFNGEIEVAPNRSEPRSCCCQCGHTKQESTRTPMFPNWYINKFCPKNPSRIDSDDTKNVSDEPSLSLESFKEGLKTFRPNTMRPPSPQDPFVVPDIEFYQRPSKLRKISSSKLSLKKPLYVNDCSNREKQLKSFHPQHSARAFSQIRASTPFSEMPSLASESSFFNTTLSTIIEPLSYQMAERKSNQSDLNDEIDLLV